MTTLQSALLRPGAPWQNWGRSVRATPAHLALPRSIDEVVEVVGIARDAGSTVKAVGAGHSFTAIAATTGVQLDLGALQGVLGVDGNLVTLAAGTRLHQLPALLAPHGLALANMGDIDRQTIAGATSTGTHGTGARFGGLATQLRAATLVTADGTVLRVSATENPELLPAVKLGLGALGVLVDVSVECVPAFLLRAVEVSERFDAVIDTFRERVLENDHFEFYLWPHTDTVMSKYNTRLPATDERHPLGRLAAWWEDDFMANRVLAALVTVGLAAPALTPPINRFAAQAAGTRSYTDHSHSVFVSPRTTRFREMEYAVPLECVPDALRDIRAAIASKGWRISFPIEVRSAAADDVWLSTATGRLSGYIAVHRYFREDPNEYFRTIGQIMQNYGGRPHWGKMHYQSAESLAESYPKFGEFLAVRDRLDPDRVFRNSYLDRVLGA
jgi:FAD-linked oxidoreductase